VDLCKCCTKFPHLPVYAVVKEVEDTPPPEDPKKLKGLEEFQSKYFQCASGIFLDQERAFYDYLGSRKIDFKLQRLLFDPLGVWRDIKELGVRTKAKGVEGNMVGDGLVQGGILVLDRHGSPVYTYREVTGSEIPSSEIVAAMERLASQESAAPAPAA